MKVSYHHSVCSSSICFTGLLWLDVKSLIPFDQGVMTYKILHGLCPDNLRHKFVERSMVSEYKTRIIEICKFPKLS